MALHSMTSAYPLASASSRALRIGALLDDGVLPAWIGSTLEQLSTGKQVELAAVLINVGHSNHRKWHPLASFCWSIDRALFRTSDDPEKRTRTLPTHTITLNREPGEFELSRIKALDLDLLLYLGAEQMDVGPLLDCAKHGIWFFESNVPQDSADSQSVLSWYGQQSQPELALKVLHPSGNVQTLYRSSLMGHNISLLRTRNAEVSARSSILLRCLSDLHEHGVSAVHDHSDHKSVIPAREVLGEPKSAQSGVANALRWLPRLTRGVINHVIPPRWVIAYRDRLSSQEFRFVVPQDGLNYADPFVFEDAGRHFMFFEAWREGHKGVISCIELREGEPTKAETVLERPYHLSYPYVFRWQKAIYMIPETAANGTIELYRAIRFPYRWELDTVLLSNTDAVDSTVLSHNNKVWLFTAGITGPELRTSELSLFFADSLHGPWIPHPRNPIVCDVHSARPAGALFFENGVLFRPGQDSSQQYGYSIQLSRIETLSETDYGEIPVSTIRPDWAPGMLATHTLNRDSRFEVRDARLSFRALASTSGGKRERKRSGTY